MRPIMRRLPWQLMPVLLLFTVGVPVLASTMPPASWANPSAVTLKLIGPAGTVPSTPYAFPSLDCDQITYRDVGLATAMRQGCFTETTYGFTNSDGQSVIFNGSDEALPILPFSAHELLLPWPDSAAVLALDSESTGGQLLSLYKNIPANLTDRRDLLGQLIAKQVRTPPDLIVRDPQGRALVINPQTLSFSPGSSWLVVETLSGYFVRVNLATLDIRPFAPAFNSLGGPGMSQSEVAISSDGRYAAVANRQAATFKVYDLSDCAGSICSAHDYWPLVASRYDGLRAVAHVRFINSGLLAFNAGGGVGSQATSYELAPMDHIASLLGYLALGDSYTSGEGAYDYLIGTDTAENSCHLSRFSYPLLLTADLFGANGGHSVACSGAVINDLASTASGYVGQMAGGQSYSRLQQSVPAFLASVQTDFLPGYIAQQRFVRQYQPAILSVSVSGDDAGFGDILERCVEPHLSRHESDQTCFNTYEDRQEIIKQVDRTRPRLVSLYKQLSASSPGSHIYAIGYPQIVVDTGSCALNVHLNKSELEFAIELVNYLNGNMRQAAADAGVQYVDISQALTGHRLCEARSYDVALNGLTAGKDGGVLGLKVFGKESYHPTALGQQLIERAILRQTDNLRSWAPQNSPPTNDSQKLLDKPKTGRPVYNRMPAKMIAPHSLQKGARISIVVNGSTAGLAANHIYLVRIDGADGPVIGSVASDENGDIAGSATLPPATDTGGHTIDLTGQNQAGEPTDVSQPVYVTDNDTDADGDGVPDGIDSCPTAFNSGQDADQDGIDDTCDGFIGQAASRQPGAVTVSSVSVAQSPTRQRERGRIPTSTNSRPSVLATSIISARSAAVFSKLAKIRQSWGSVPILLLGLLASLALLYLIYKIARRLTDDE